MKVLFDEEGRVDLDSMAIKDDDFNPERFPGSHSRGSGQDTPVQIDPEVLIPGMSICHLIVWFSGRRAAIHCVWTLVEVKGAQGENWNPRHVRIQHTNLTQYHPNTEH